MIRVTLSDWRHGEVECPGCGLPVDAQHDEVEEFRSTSSEPDGAIVRHRCCGARFQIEFASGARR
jgi:phage terminase large subunit GpA-like protein